MGEGAIKEQANLACVCLPFLTTMSQRYSSLSSTRAPSIGGGQLSPFSAGFDRLARNTPSFVDCWTIAGHQKLHIACLSTSPSGKWLLSSSEDCTVHFIEFQSGWVVAELHLDYQFSVLCCAWCSDSIVIAGGSNGLLYVLEFQPQNVRYRATKYRVVH